MNSDLTLFISLVASLTKAGPPASLVKLRHWLLSKLRGRAPFLRVSLYADDAALFLAPKKVEVDSLIKILSAFGEATGLNTNFHKSTVVPIRCNSVDIDGILQNLPAKRAAFPIRYLGLPLSASRLRKGEGPKLATKGGVNVSRSKFLPKFKPSAYIPKITRALKRSGQSLE